MRYVAASRTKASERLSTLAPIPMNRTSKAARHGMLGAAVGLAVLLIGMTGWGWRQIHIERHGLVTAEGTIILEHLLPCAREHRLEECVLEGAGVRWIKLDDAPIYGAQAFGVDVYPDVRPPRGAFVILLDDGYARVQMPLPQRGPPPKPDHPPPSVQFDFQPLMAERLEADARAAFFLALIVGIGLLFATVWLDRLRIRAERAEADSARNRELAAMGTMSAVLAHEIRNPVAVLLGNAQLLAEEHDNEQSRHMVEGARRLRALTENLLAFAQTGNVRRAPIDPRGPARAALGERGSLNADRAPAVWSLDPERIEQLLSDLIDNAPTPVELRVYVDPEGDPEGDPGALVYEVRDHGDGLPPGDPERLFEPFFTTRARGTGLGLAVARRLTEAHGGTITAANHPLGGAVFTVRIPGAP